jgi:MFS family permease
MFWRDIKNEPKEVLNWRLWVSTVVFGLMGAARGLDEGTISGTVKHPSFIKQFGLEDPTKTESQLANLKSNITSMVQIGCIGGAILGFLVNDRLGRIKSYRLMLIIWLVGVIISITSFKGIGQLYAGRLIAGIGVGMTSVVCPTYAVEVAPANVRGLCACMYSGSVYLGVMIGQFANLGTTIHIPDDDRNQWVIPTSVQIIYAGIFFIGSFFTIESPRWLYKIGKNEQAASALSRIRNLPQDHPYVVWEVSQILSQVNAETEKFKFWKAVEELFTTY